MRFRTEILLIFVTMCYVAEVKGIVEKENIKKAQVRPNLQSNFSIVPTLDFLQTRSIGKNVKSITSAYNKKRKYEFTVTQMKYTSKKTNLLTKFPNYYNSYFNLYDVYAVHNRDTGSYEETMSSQFLDLQPAVDDSISLNKNLIDCKTSWYTIENSPCWKLPLVYGDVYLPLNNNEDVFSMYNNIIEVAREPKSNSTNDYTYMTYRTTRIKYRNSKWCDSEPCFADHTLCLFAKDIITACGKDYAVKKPNALERVGIMNTINSMRNKVANGQSNRYSHLPTAANMQKVLYDQDLEKMAERWLMQCIPGSAPCSSIDGQIVTDLECTKLAKLCCFKTDPTSKCKAKDECYVFSIIGCLYIWYWKAGEKLTKTDVNCGRATPLTFPSVQLLWAKTTKIGCAYAVHGNGDERVVCNFSPRASFYVDSKLYCGVLSYHHNVTFMNITQDAFSTKLNLLWKYNADDYTFALLKLIGNSSMGDPLYWKRKKFETIKEFVEVYKYEKPREYFGDLQNGTKSWISVQMAKHKFVDESASKCDSGEHVYKIGAPGAACSETGRLYYSLCDAFRDPTPGYRLITLIAAIVLFSLVLCDLFSGVVRQNNF